MCLGCFRYTKISNLKKNKETGKEAKNGSIIIEKIDNRSRPTDDPEAWFSR